MTSDERRLGRSRVADDRRGDWERRLARGWLVRFEDRERLLARGPLRDEERGALLARGALRDEDRLEELALEEEPEDFDPEDAREPSFRGVSALASSAGSTRRAPSIAADHQPELRRGGLPNVAAVFHMIVLLLRSRPVSPTPMQATNIVVA